MCFAQLSAFAQLETNAPRIFKPYMIEAKSLLQNLMLLKHQKINFFMIFDFYILEDLCKLLLV